MINVFDGYLWRTPLGGLMFRVAELPVPPDLSGEYRGAIELYAVTNPAAVFRTSHFMRVVQTWEQISLLVERESETAGLVRVHSDMASIRVGMMRGVVTLRFVYTFEENLPRGDGVGVMTRQLSGAATLEFRRERDAWVVAGHFFDDIGRSGQVSVAQVLSGAPVAASRASGSAGLEQRPAEPGATPDRQGV